jgi:hypothetical protein
MSPLRQALADYLAVRRVLGYRLVRTEKLLAQFITYVEARGEDHPTTATALAWATLSPGAHRVGRPPGCRSFAVLPFTCKGSTRRPRCRRGTFCRGRPVAPRPISIRTRTLPP